ncbi:acyl-CoA dehydrogenase family protein [Thermodesulfobacteriota bacterium]
MDFGLSEEQIMLQRATREFAEKEIRPVVKALEDEPDPMDRVDWDLIKKASKLGYRTLTFPEEYGGVGADCLTTMIHYEALSWGDGSFSHYFFQLHIVGPSFDLMPEEQRELLMPGIVEDDTFLIGAAHTEPLGATEYTMPYNVPGGAFQTFAEKKGDEYIINGTKLYCSNGPIAKMFFVSAQTDRKAPLSESWTQFMVPPDTPGVSLGKPHEHMGMRLLPTAEVVFDNVRVPARNRVGEEGGGMEAHHKIRPWILTIHNGQMLGMLQALYDETLEFAKTRVVCGKPIIEHDTVKIMLANMRMKIEAARGLVYRTAWNIDHKKDDFKENTELVYLTKAFLDEAGLTIMRDADEIHGGMGTNKDMMIEKLIRDTFTMLHWMNTRSIAYLKGAPTLEGVTPPWQPTGKGVGI